MASSASTAITGHSVSGLHTATRTTSPRVGSARATPEKLMATNEPFRRWPSTSPTGRAMTVASSTAFNDSRMCSQKRWATPSAPLQCEPM